MDDQAAADVAGSEYTPQRRPGLLGQMPHAASGLRSGGRSSSDEEEGEINAARASNLAGPSSSSQSSSRGADGSERKASSSLLDRIDRSRRAPLSQSPSSERFGHSHPDREARMTHSSSWSERSSTSAAGQPAFAPQDVRSHEGRAGYGRWRDTRPQMYPSRHAPRSPYDGPGSAVYRRAPDWSAQTSGHRDTLRESERMRSTSTPDYYSTAEKEHGTARFASGWDRGRRDRGWRDATRGKEGDRGWDRSEAMNEYQDRASSPSRHQRGQSPLAQSRTAPIESTTLSPSDATMKDAASRHSLPESASTTSAQPPEVETSQRCDDHGNALSTSAELLGEQRAEYEEVMQGSYGPTSGGAPAARASQVPQSSATNADRATSTEKQLAREIPKESIGSISASASHSEPMEGKDAAMEGQESDKTAAALDLRRKDGGDEVNKDDKSDKESCLHGAPQTSSFIVMSDTPAQEGNVHALPREMEASAASQGEDVDTLTAQTLALASTLPELAEHEFDTGDKTNAALGSSPRGKMDEPLDSLALPNTEEDAHLPIPALQVEGTADNVGVTKRPKSRASSRSKDRSASDSAQIISLFIKRKGQHRPNDRLFRNIVSANRRIVQRSTASERAPAFRDHCQLSAKTVNQSAIRRRISPFLSRDKSAYATKLEKLRAQYRRLHASWQAHCNRLDNSRELREAQRSRPALHASMSTPVAPLSLTSQQASGQQSTVIDEANLGLLSSASMTRANRRNTQPYGLASFGDAVRSEAEFLEILASLENADMQDPSARAARTTAAEPDMKILSSEHRAKSAYDDDEGFVADPIAFYFDSFDPDFWSEEEKSVFERRYTLYPKQFGKIATALPHKTTAQCVNYYYMTKKEVGYDYKTMLASRGRDRRRKTRVKPRKGRGSALMADLKADEVEDDQLGYDELPARRTGARSRMLSALKVSDPDAVNEDGESVEAIVQTRKRRPDDVQGEEAKAARPRTARRTKAEKKSRLVIDEMITSTDSAVSDIKAVSQEQSATPALVDAASGASLLREEITDVKKKRRGKQPAAFALERMGENGLDGLGTNEESGKRARNSTSSYWSVVERTEFLRSLAIYGKEWDAIAKNLPTKSAAQARNFFLRNAEDVDVAEAAAIASDNAHSTLEDRTAAANDFVEKRSKAVQASAAGDRAGSVDASAIGRDDDEEDMARDASRSENKHGLNISSLLNDVASDARKPNVRQWFGKSEPSDDDTEDEDGTTMVRSSAAAAAFLPPGSQRSAEMSSRGTYPYTGSYGATTEFQRPHAGTPQMSSFSQAEHRREHDVPSFSYGTTRMRDAYSDVRGSRDMTNAYPGSTFSRPMPAPPTRPGSQTVTLRDGSDHSWSRAGQPAASPSSPYHPMRSELRPSSFGAPHLSSAGWQRTDTRELYPRPSLSSGTLQPHPHQERESPGLYRSPMHRYDGQGPSGSFATQPAPSALRSLSPLPFAQQPPAPSYPRLSPATAAEDRRGPSPSSQAQTYTRYPHTRYDGHDRAPQ